MCTSWGVVSVWYTSWSLPQWKQTPDNWPLSPHLRCAHICFLFTMPLPGYTHILQWCLLILVHSSDPPQRVKVLTFPPLWSLLYGHPLESSWVPIWGNVSYRGRSWGKFLITVSRLLRAPPKPFSCYRQLMRLCDCHSPNKVIDSVCAERRRGKVYKPHLKSIFVFVYMSATVQVQTCPSVSQRQ